MDKDMKRRLRALSAGVAAHLRREAERLGFGEGEALGAVLATWLTGRAALLGKGPTGWQALAGELDTHAAQARRHAALQAADAASAGRSTTARDIIDRHCGGVPEYSVGTR